MTAKRETLSLLSAPNATENSGNGGQPGGSCEVRVGVTYLTFAKGVAVGAGETEE